MTGRNVLKYFGGACCVVFGALGVMLAVERPDAPIIVEAKTADSFESAIAERIQLAQRTLAGAKAEFQNGMRRGRTLYLTIRLMDSAGSVEQVFVQADRWSGVEITGRIASAIQKVAGYQKGQNMSFGEGDILDWTIQNPDGTSEGNYVGNFVEQWQDASAAR